MSRQDDDRRLRKLEYLEQRGVATLEDKIERKKLARKMAEEDFDRSEVSRLGRTNQDVFEKKGSFN